MKGLATAPRVVGVALGLLALAAAPRALADEEQYATPRWGAFELSISGYHPRIDAEFGGTASPYATVFGGGRGWMFRADVAKSLMVSYGTLDVGVGGGYWERGGHGLLPDGTASGDGTMLKVVPSRIFVRYLFDYVALRYPVPIAPYVRLSFDRYWWWVNNGSGHVANAGGLGGSGATNGYSFSGGVALLLNFIDRTLAREMDRDTGINQTYAFVEFTKSYVKNFGSSKSWDLSDDQVTLSGGLLFMF